MTKQFTLELPRTTGTTETLSTNNSVLFIGANGSGKTRLGAWIDLESPQYEKVHRISAQKSLSMPDTTTSVSIEKAKNSLWCGYADYNGDEVNYKYYKQNQRWQQKPAIPY